MAIGPKGPPQKPGLSIRGRVIFDTVRGVPRVRPWPPSKPTKPGSRREWTAKAFAAANRACKVTASTFYGDNWEATRGTPLLPRDLMIAFMYGRAVAFTLEDETEIWSMQARADVSKSLDVLGKTQGAFLVRGPKYWETTTLAGNNPQWFLMPNSINNTDTVATATRGYIMEVHKQIKVAALSVSLLTAPGRSYRARLALVDPSNVVQTVLSSPEQTVSYTGRPTLIFELAATLEPGERVAFLASRTDAGGSATLNCHFTGNNALSIPASLQGRCAIAKEEPEPGDALGFASGFASTPIINLLASETP